MGGLLEKTSYGEVTQVDNETAIMGRIRKNTQSLDDVASFEVWNFVSALLLILNLLEELGYYLGPAPFSYPLAKGDGSFPPDKLSHAMR